MKTNLQDNRLLAVAYYSMELRVNGRKIKIDFRNALDCKIYGFYESESWGTWSAGGKSCLYFPNIEQCFESLDLIIDAHPFIDAFKSCCVLFKTSYGYQGRAKITEKSPLTVPLKRSLVSRRHRLVVGDFSKAQSPRNVSLNEEIPTVSIVLLNHERSLLSYLASVAVASSGIKVPFEILCADNGSSRENISELKKGEVPFRILELGKNFGFGSANNLAARQARGEYLLFLNNDAFLDEGALDEMLRAFQEMPDCRIAGSVLRFPDGTMQEAGATLQPDAHPIRHGRNDPRFKTRKIPRFQPVDYVSGACLIIRSTDFLEMGGFDEKYSPAYYEDTDFCMRSLLYGQKVYLASRANCYHIENATTSTIEQGAWATKTAEAHREIFLKDWGAYLESRDSKDLPWHLKNVPLRRCDAAR